MCKPSEEKIFKEIDKATSTDQITELYQKIKDYCTKKLVEAHKKHSDIAEDLISRIDKMNSGK